MPAPGIQIFSLTSLLIFIDYSGNNRLVNRISHFGLSENPLSPLFQQKLDLFDHFIGPELFVQRQSPLLIQLFEFLLPFAQCVILYRQLLQLLVLQRVLSERSCHILVVLYHLHDHLCSISFL